MALIINKITFIRHFLKIKSEWLTDFNDNFKYTSNPNYFITVFNNKVIKAKFEKYNEGQLHSKLSEIKNQLELDNRISCLGLVYNICEKDGRDFGITVKHIAEITALESVWSIIESKRKWRVSHPATENIGLREKIIIKTKFINSTYSLLKDFFPKNNAGDLYKILNGEEISTKLIFQSEGNKLLDVFWYLSKPDVKIVITSRTKIAEWIFSHFRYLKNKKESDFNLANAKRTILSQTRNCANPIPDIEKILNPEY